MKPTNSGRPRVLLSELLKQAVIGISDGHIVIFALSTALTVGFPRSASLIPYTLNALIIGGIIIGIGGFLSARYRMERMAARSEEQQTEENRIETEKTLELFEKLDLGEDMQRQAREEIIKETDEWKTYLAFHQQDLEPPVKAALPLTGLIISFSFFTGGLIALLPYFFEGNAAQAFNYSLLFNFPLLLLIGIFKSNSNGEHLIWGSLRLLLLGSAVVAAAYLVAQIFVA